MTPEQAESAYAIMAGSGVLTNLLLAEFRRTHGLPPLKALTLDNTPITPDPPRGVADLQGVEGHAARFAQKPTTTRKRTRRKGREPDKPADPVTRWDLATERSAPSLLELGELGEAA